jgi:hypothetical protein
MAGAAAAKVAGVEQRVLSQRVEKNSRKHALDLIEFVGRATGLPRCGFDPATNGE